MMAPLFEHYGIQLWTPEAGGPVYFQTEEHDLAMIALGIQALVARADAQSALNGLFLSLGAVGVANIMIISGWSAAQRSGSAGRFGATRNHIRVQFLSEAILLAVLGGAAGVTAGALATAMYAAAKGWATVIPPLAWAGGLGAAIAIGALAGLLPAVKATRMSPTEAPWSLREPGADVRRTSRGSDSTRPRTASRPDRMAAAPGCSRASMPVNILDPRRTRRPRLRHLSRLGEPGKGSVSPAYSEPAHWHFPGSFPGEVTFGAACRSSKGPRVAARLMSPRVT